MMVKLSAKEKQVSVLFFDKDSADLLDSIYRICYVNKLLSVGFLHARGDVSGSAYIFPCGPMSFPRMWRCSLLCSS